jgi:hypothetical protein
MNRADFNNIIHDSGTVNRQTIGEIRELLDLFPYFQSAHMLLLKGLNNTSDIKFESQLKKSAIYVADREVLYHLINDNRTIEINNESAQAVETVILERPDSPDNQQTVIESGKNSLDLINESEKNQNVPVENVNIDLPSHGILRSLLITEESDEDDSVNIVFLLDDGQEHAEDTVIFRDPAIFIPEENDLLELDIQEGNSDMSEKSVEVNPVPEAVEKPSRKQVQSDLIDKFIIANPRIEPVRDKSDHPIEDKSNQFSEEKGGFITETLAKIYVNQGYYSKAIDIYEKLSLKFPEKSSYFAAQIEKVKGLIK